MICILKRNTVEWDDFQEMFQNQLPSSLVLPFDTQSHQKKFQRGCIQTHLPIGHRNFTTLAM